MTRYEQFWADNPTADYWYYSQTLRALNPARTRELLDNPKPWPVSVHSTTNREKP